MYPSSRQNKLVVKEGIVMRKIEFALIVLAVCFLAIGIASYFSFQTTASRVQPATNYYT